MQNWSNDRSKTFGRTLIAATLFALGLASNTAAQTRIRLATLIPSGTSYHHSLQDMGAKWKAASNGALSLTIYADGTMGSEDEVVRRMRVGQLQAAVITVAGLAQIDRSVSALQEMPLVYRSLDEAAFVREKLAPELDRRLAAKGFVVLFWVDAGWVRFFSKSPGMVPEDFKKMKIFVTAGDVTQSDLLKSAGYNPVLLEWSDALTSLQTGMIDAVPTIPLQALTGQYFLSTHHMLEVNWIPLVGALVMTKKSWDALQPSEQDAIMKSAAQCGQEFQAHGRQESQESLEAMAKRGLQIHPVNKEQQEAWERFSESIYPKIRGNLVPADMFDNVLQLVREYRGTQGASGK